MLVDAYTSKQKPSLLGQQHGSVPQMFSNKPEDLSTRDSPPSSPGLKEPQG